MKETKKSMILREVPYIVAQALDVGAKGRTERGKRIEHEGMTLAASQTFFIHEDKCGWHNAGIIEAAIYRQCVTWYEGLEHFELLY